MSSEIQLYSKLQPADVVTMGMTLGKSGCFGAVSGTCPVASLNAHLESEMKKARP